jgi:hypothetical protein
MAAQAAAAPRVTDGESWLCAALHIRISSIAMAAYNQAERVGQDANSGRLAKEANKAAEANHARVLGSHASGSHRLEPK